MNDFTVTVTNPERRAFWMETLGTTTVPVKSPIRTLANLPGHPRAEIYLLDIDLIEPDKLTRLVAFLSKRFGMSDEDAAKELREQGIPILADDCIVTVTNPQRWV